MSNHQTTQLTESCNTQTKTDTAANVDAKTRKIIGEIRHNCIDNMIILCKIVRDIRTIKLLQQLSIDIRNSNNEEQYSNIAKTISNKWCNPMIKKMYTSANNLIDNYDNMQYFYNKIDEIMNINYIPNVDDIKRHKRYKTFVMNNDTSNYKNSFDNSETIYYHEKDAKTFFTLPLFSNANIGFAVEIPDIFKHRFFDPINSNPFVKKIQVAKIFNSKTKPYLIDCYVEYNDQKYMLSSRYILKKGDDIRYDYCLLKLFNKMNEIWTRNKLNTHCITYECIPIGNNIGIIEIKPNCIPLNKILQMKQIFLTEPNTFYTLIDTTAGAFIGSYVCGVRDRHYDNILINKTNGQLFNIDFGYVFGAACKLNASKIPITQQLKHILKLYECGWDDFVRNACQAWLVLRQNAKELIDFGTELFQFDSEYKKSNKIKEFMTDSLKLNMRCENAQKYIYNEMDNSANTLMTQMKNSLHDLENFFGN